MSYSLFEKCWACDSVLDLSSCGEHTVSFKCGFCGAYNSRAALAARGHGVVLRPPWALRMGRRCAAWLTGMVIVAVFALGVAVVLPPLTSSSHYWLLSIVAALMFLQILVHFVGAASHRHGIRMGWQRGALQHCSKGEYDGCVLCDICHNLKPLGAHHCRTCGTCVMALDHHCVFLNNCVAAANMRHFLLFLSWLGLGSAYVALACSLLLWYRRAQAIQFFYSSRPLWFPSKAWQWPFITWRIALAAPAWLTITLYLLLLASSTCLGVATLMWQQLRALRRQQTHVDALKSGQYNPVRLPLWDAWRQVMGSGNPITWLLPRLKTDRGPMQPGGFGKSE
eukprot:jgi/Botrbrau1/9405/Bobra.0252s0030.1